MIANQRLQRIAPARSRRLFAAQLVGLRRAARSLRSRLACKRLAQRGNLRLQPLQRVAPPTQIAAAPARLARPGSPARCAPGPSPPSAAPPRAPARPGSLRPAPCELRALPASVSRCMAWRRSASSSRSARKHLFGRGRAPPAAAPPPSAGTRAPRRPRSPENCFCCARSSVNPGQLRSRLLQLRAATPQCALSSSAHALRVAALARRRPLQLHGRFAGARLRLLPFAVQLVAALGQRVLAGFLLRSISSAELLIRSVSAAISASSRAWSASIAAMRLASTTRSRPRSSSRTAA